MKNLSRIFYIIALISSYTMVCVVSYNYGIMEMGIRYCGYSAPANVSFLVGIPFLIVMIIFLILGYITSQKARKNEEE